MLWIMVLWLVIVAFCWVVVASHPIPADTPVPTVPKPIIIDKEADFLARIKQVKALVDAGKYDKAIALLKRLEVVYSIPKDITTTTTT